MTVELPVLVKVDVPADMSDNEIVELFMTALLLRQIKVIGVQVLDDLDDLDYPDDIDDDFPVSVEYPNEFMDDLEPPF